MAVKWTEEQEQVIALRDRNLLVSAAAGSGKTAVLVERILSRVTDPVNPIDIDRLLVVTFTKAARGEASCAHLLLPMACLFSGHRQYAMISFRGVSPASAADIVGKAQDFIVAGGGSLIGNAGAGRGVNGSFAEYRDHIFSGFYACSGSFQSG